MRSRTDEVSVLEVEAVELVASRLSIHYVFIDDECSAFSVVGDALANLAIQCQYRVAGDCACDLGRIIVSTYRTGPNLPKRSKSSSGVTLKLRRN